MLRGYRKISSYYSTHPPTEERIEAARQFRKKTGIKGKLFQVDSMQFAKIKARAADECIYLLFEELRFDECLEMAFLQYLFHPNDEFYQYFIVASLKSKMASEKYYGEYPFITAFYDSGKLKSPKSDAVCRDVKSGEYMRSKYYRMSVFNNLQSPIFSLSPEQVQNLKDRHFLNPDTIPFFTNQQALAYFLKILSGSQVFNTIRMKYELPVKERSGEKKYQSELEKNLCDIYTHFKDYNAKRDSMEKGMVILHNVNFYEVRNRSLRDLYSTEMQKNIFRDFTAYSDSNRLMDIISENRLNFRERSKIKNIADFAESIPEENFSGKYADIDFLDVCPEFVMQATKNHVETIFIVKLYLYPVSCSYAVVYGLDIRNKRIGITNIPLECSYTTSPDKIFGKVFGECKSLIRN
jgi:N-glycosylase/DNA lyase